MKRLRKGKQLDKGHRENLAEKGLNTGGLTSPPMACTSALDCPLVIFKNLLSHPI